MEGANTTEKENTAGDQKSFEEGGGPTKIDERYNVIEKLVSKTGSQSNLKNLYENIGTRVSKLREINEGYQKRIKDQESEIKLLDERIEKKRHILEIDMRGKGEGRDGIKIHDPEWVNQMYNELLAKAEIKMKINQNHIHNDPALKKLYQEKESELSQLKNHLNNLIKKTEHIKGEINVLRIENNKHRMNLDIILAKKEQQNKEMDKISEEANKYLNEKGKINEELVKLNEKIDAQKIEHESKVQELSKMIDNTKKIKEFHETLAFEKFSNNAFRKSNYSANATKPMNKIAEEKTKLNDLHLELEKKKKLTVFFNFSKLILLKKQQELNTVIEKVKHETGIDDLDKLSSDLQLSTKTNKLFESDLKSLHEQKQQLEINIEEIKKEIQNALCVLNDTSIKKSEYIEKLAKDLAIEEETKEKFNKRLFAHFIHYGRCPIIFNVIERLKIILNFENVKNHDD